MAEELVYEAKVVGDTIVFVQKEKQPQWGYASAIGTFILLAYISYWTGALGTVAREMLLLLTGRVNEIPHDKVSFLIMIPIMLATVVIDLTFSVTLSHLQEAILGKCGKHASDEFFSKMNEDTHFQNFFTTTFFEELFARGLFLGLLTKLPFLGGPVGFYILLLLGNSLWSLIHLDNYRDQKDRQLSRLIPQFIGGIFFSYIFVKYGFIEAVLTHFASNAVLFATHKTQRITYIDGLLLLYSVLCAVASYSFMTKPVGDIALWFAVEPTLKLPGWEFIDYVVVSIFLWSCGTAILGLLVYDHTPPDPEKKEGFIDQAVTLTIGLVILTVLYWALGFLIPSIFERILLLTLLLGFSLRSGSGSALARTFWWGLPTIFIALCILQALGFWQAIAYAAIDILVALPEKALKKCGN